MRVDGKVADARACKVDPAKQKITVSGRAVKAVGHGAGSPSTSRSASSPPPSDEEGRRTVFDFIPDPAGLTYVGPARRDDHGPAAAHHRRRGGASADAPALPDSAAATPRWSTAGPPPRSASAVEAERGRSTAGRWIPRDVRVAAGHGGPEHHRRDARRRVGTASSAGGPRRWDSRWSGWRACRTARCGWATCRRALPAAHAEGGEGAVQGDPDGLSPNLQSIRCTAG